MCVCVSGEIFSLLVNAANAECWVGALFQTFGSYFPDILMWVYRDIYVVGKCCKCRMLGWRTFPDFWILLFQTF